MVSFRHCLVKRYGDDIQRAAPEKPYVPHTEWYISDDPNTIYRVLRENADGRPSSDLMCAKCEKFDLRTTRWMRGKDADYHRNRDRILARQKMEQETAERARVLYAKTELIGDDFGDNFVAQRSTFDAG